MSIKVTAHMIQQPYVTIETGGVTTEYFFDEEEEAQEFCDWVNKPENQTHLQTLFLEYQ